MPEITDFRMLLTFLVSGSGALVWMKMYSDFLRNLSAPEGKPEGSLEWRLAAFYSTFSPLARQAVYFIGSMAVPLIALVLLNVISPEMFEQINSVWGFAAALFVSYLEAGRHYQNAKLKG